jgi:Zn-dependent M28 family amino/carboxypeptidase
MLAHNMVALFEGTDPELKDEVIVLTSHYDHIGIGRADSTGDTLYNGADDDGSGTIGLLAAANAMQKAKEAGAEIRRSVLFLHVTAEEKGLLGSRYYSDYPIFPIEKTVANLNADMIGRIGDEYQDSLDQDYVYVIGAEIISSQLDSLLQVGNEKTDNIKLDMRYNDLDHPQQFYRRSDHWNFGRLGVPFAFFFNGTHEDYHRPGDEIHKIAFPQLAQRARVMYGTAIELANWDDRPVVDNQLFIERTQE